MHAKALEFVHRVVRQIPARFSVVEFGSRDVNGSVRYVFCCKADLWPVYVGVDLMPGPGVDVVADAAEWTPLDPPDTVVCCGTLEHTPRAEALMQRAGEILAPGGVCIVTTVADPWPPHSAIDGGPLRPGEFYRNVSAQDLRRWLGWSNRVDLVLHQNGDLFAVAWKGARDAFDTWTGFPCA